MMSKIKNLEIIFKLFFRQQVSKTILYSIELDTAVAKKI